PVTGVPHVPHPGRAPRHPGSAGSLRPMSHVALVTDSTASLPPEVADKHGIIVVPLQVVIGAKSYDEGVEGGATAQTVADALKKWTPVSTSRPTPAAMLEVYEEAAAAGATE